jgi:hypothetical protein
MGGASTAPPVLDRTVRIIIRSISLSRNIYWDHAARSLNGAAAAPRVTAAAPPRASAAERLPL